MPAASTKPENKVSQESSDPMKQVLVVVDKKVRNLEKRKGKLDVYIEKENEGSELEKDQKAAVAKYGEVVQNLEFARELQKQFTAISADAEKILKKQAKREKAIQQNIELKRIKEMLQLQNLLDNLGSEKVRTDFQTGKHGAVVLTEDNLNQLDELYKLISPTRDGETDYQEQLNAAGEHIVNLIDAKEKEVVGTTYKELKELIDLINQCGYFENAPLQEEEEPAATTEEEFSVPNSTETTEVQAPEETYEQHQQQIEQFGSTVTGLETNQQDMSSVAASADSYFSKPAQQPQQTEEEEDDPAYSRQRPFQEIVSSVQGNFNFLQESTIDMESPHMDPAVVAAHPMPSASLGRPTSTHSADATTLSQQAFSSQPFGDLQQNQQSITDQSQSDPQSLMTHQQQQSVSALSGQDYSSQTFAQNSLSQSIQNDSLFQNSVKDNTQPLSSMGQPVSDTTISQFELPPSLPMPPSRESTQESQSVDTQPEKKQFTMNPNAGVFQSQIYTQSSVDNPQQQQHQQNDFGGQSDFQNDSYHSGGFSRRGGGGFRGNRGRGGSSDRGNMNNGYSGNRGGRGNYNDRRGGYQGYPPRNDYRPEGGYQGQNYNGNYNSGFQKRGGSMRGNSSRGNSGGAMRGGPPRGSSRGRGGFGRPNNQQQQAA